MAHTRRTIRSAAKTNKSKRLEDVKTVMSSSQPKGEYTEAIGRRKTSVARVRVFPAKEMSVSVNGKDHTEYFGTDEQRRKVMQSLSIEEQKNKYAVSAYVKGSGPNAQAEAIRLGIARALVEIDEDLRSPLKSQGFLKRDPRSVERKKFGLLKARKKPAWVKR